MPRCGSCHKNRLQHFKPKKKPMMQSQPETCDICGVTNWQVSYCGFCGKWLCQDCVKNPLKRFKAAAKEIKKKFINKQ